MTHLSDMAKTQITEVQLKNDDSEFRDVNLNSDTSTATDASSRANMIQAAISELKISIRGTEIENDHETQLLIQLIASSIPYSTLPVVASIKKLREMLLIRKEIIKEIQKDRKKYIEMNSTFFILAENLFYLMKKCKNDLCSKFPTLELAKGELTVIIDALYPEVIYH